MKKEQIEALELPMIFEQVARQCAFSLGRAAILNLVPSFDELYVKHELRRTKEALNMVIRYGDMPFGAIHDISDSVTIAKKDMTLSAMELRRIADGIRAIAAIVKYMKGSEIETPELDELVGAFADAGKLAIEIESCISLNDEVLDGASSELRSIRRSIQTLQAQISSQVQKFISANGSKLTDTITAVRNERICVLVKISEKNSVSGFIHGESASGQTAYVEPECLLQLNNRLQSLHSREQDEIMRILFGLSQLVKEYSDALLANLDTCVVLDALFAKAKWGKLVQGCVGDITSNKDRLYLKAARHPLIDPKQVVANTYEIGASHRTLLITGSNTGGKTVTLKTIGLFAAMTMCGLPLPAEEAEIPLYDDIYVDIGDDQSIVESLSTFSSHLSKLAMICQHATGKSLVLLDELGSGTDPKEGESLAIAILDELRERGCTLIATTHFSQVKTYGAKCDDVLLSCVEFDVEAMRPTYRYIAGLSGQSNAFEIARRFQLKESIIERARAYKEANRSDQEGLMEKLEEALLQAEHDKDQLARLKAEAEQLQQELNRERNKLQKERVQILEKAEQQAEELIESTQAEGDEIISKLKAMTADVKPHELTAVKTKLNALSKESEPDASPIEESFAVGDYVQLLKHGYFGEIIALQKEKATVLSNGLKMQVKLSELTHANRPKTKKIKASYSKAIQQSFPLELNLLGMYVDEALPVVDKYLDNAILAKVSVVRIIHGNGTGALRKGVHQFLKHHARVESFRMGGEGEGGLGATVVTLKMKGKH